MKILFACIVSGGILIAAALGHAGQAMTLEESLQPQVQCELFAKKCISEADLIQKRIRELEQEINKGTRSYKPEDIEQLKRKLEEVNRLLDKLDSQ